MRRRLARIPSCEGTLAVVRGTSAWHRCPLCYECLLHRNLIYTTSQALVPRAVLQDVGLTDPRFPLGSDWDLYIRIAASYDVTFLRRSLVRWRYVDNSASGPAQLRPLRWAKDHIAILKKHQRCAPSKYRPLIRTLLSQKLHETADQTYWYGRQSDAVWARRHLLALLRQNLSSPSPAIFLLALCLPRRLVHLMGRAFRPGNRRPSLTGAPDHHSRLR